MAQLAKFLSSTAGVASGGGAGLDVDEVFSCHLHEGTGSAQTITNSIDLSGEGGLVWIKNRENQYQDHSLFDTTRSPSYVLYSNTTSASSLSASRFSSFNSDGFTLGTDTSTNESGKGIVSWTFRKAPKFFDIVTWTGNSTSGRAISHNLGVTPGFIAVKRTNLSSDWIVLHRNDGTTSKSGWLNLPDDLNNRDSAYFSADPDDSVFYLGSSFEVNRAGDTYVAYIFAHNNNDGEFGPDSDQDVIKCGSLTLTSGNVTEEILGWEPQWLLVKKLAEQNWQLIDNMRGFVSAYDGDNLSSRPLIANTSAIESNLQAAPLSNGFALDANNWGTGDYIYMAIRRGPLAVPEDATKVFGVSAYTSDGTNGRVISSSPSVVDLILNLNRDGGNYSVFYDRLRGSKKELSGISSGAEETATNEGVTLDTNKGTIVNSAGYYDWPNHGSEDQVVYSWKRAPGYFDVVTYTGNSTAGRTVSHNLGVAPEMMWVKARSEARAWSVYHTGMGNTHFAKLNTTNAAIDYALAWNDTTPTETYFTLGRGPFANGNGQTFIAYLFATVAGVSKVGSYSGNGGTQTIDCGFSSGARFVMIKRTNGTGNWIVFDTQRGIVSGNDPHLFLNTTGAEVTSYDLVDPASSGFAVHRDGNAYDYQETNASGANYIFYAIA